MIQLNKILLLTKMFLIKILWMLLKLLFKHMIKIKQLKKNINFNKFHK